MKIELEQISPMEIEKRSFEIITEELQGRTFDPWQEPIIKRVIHTTADFDYADNLVFSEGVVQTAHNLFREGAC
ncbi:MAG: precorrin-8X methylmutase, partial [Lachnospiraceae bacterium]|nr:precorrin-8X methylmutase [Lachnospiraceae bacterium]